MELAKSHSDCWLLTSAWQIEQPVLSTESYVREKHEPQQLHGTGPEWVQVLLWLAHSM